MDNVTKEALQKAMDDAFDNFLTLSDLLRSDLDKLLTDEVDSQYWRRNFIRVTASLIEGNAHCLRDMCVISLSCEETPEISAKEEKVLKSEDSFCANDRVKLTLRAAYKLFELQPIPNFGGNEWELAQKVLEKRHLLMHPKTLTDLEVTDNDWHDFYKSTIWLLKQVFNFSALLQKKYGN